VPSYLVETYLARGQAGERTTREARARSAAEELTRTGTRVCFERAYHLLDDEICFFVFAAPSGRDARTRGRASCARPDSRRRSNPYRRGALSMGTRGRRRFSMGLAAVLAAVAVLAFGAGGNVGRTR
jgi:hypothetical protein